MKRICSIFGLAVIFSVMAVASASAQDRQPNQFAVGSAKTEISVVVDAEHASFSVHSATFDPLVPCEAKGHMVYRNPAAGLEFLARLERLVVDPLTRSAFFAGRIKKVDQGPPSLVGVWAWFDAVDSGMPGGAGDLFRLEGFATFGPCLSPFGGHPITSGNIVIKTTGP